MALRKLPAASQSTLCQLLKTLHTLKLSISVVVIITVNLPTMCSSRNRPSVSIPLRSVQNLHLQGFLPTLKVARQQPVQLLPFHHS